MKKLVGKVMSKMAAAGKVKVTKAAPSSRKSSSGFGRVAKAAKNVIGSRRK